jgi:predicted dehydrogenase
MMSGGVHDVEVLRMVVGEIASVHALRLAGAPICLFSERADSLPAGGAAAQHGLQAPAADVFEREIAHFVACVRRGREPETNGRDRQRPLEAVLAAYRSMETGQPPAP